MSDFTSQVSSTTEFFRPIEVLVVKKYKQRYWLHALLLLLTVFTMLIVGARMEFNFLHGMAPLSLGNNSLSFFPIQWALAEPSRLLLGIPFAATLITILLAHEMGHYLYCVHYGVQATLPFFIPAPTLIGTLGAFIRIRGPIRSRSALFDIGITGPIAGFIAAVVVLAIALPMSKIVPAGVARSELGYPLIFRFAWKLIAGSVPLSRIYLNPMAIAAWVGMFATALNLLPGGQLDGGHIVYSVAPRAHKWVSRLTILALVPLAIYCWIGWAVWAVLLAITGMRHPPVESWPSIQGGRKWLALCGLIILVLTLTPAPFAGGSLLAAFH
jgi:membrane-associated protease RseP (regulator of RpoE activity)